MDFVLVGALVAVLGVAVLQLALVLHVRATLVDCAAEGARYAAQAGHRPADGVERTRLLASQAVSSGYARDVTAVRTVVGGVDLVEVTVRAPFPVVGLVGPSGELVVRGHALVEGG